MADEDDLRRIVATLDDVEEIDSAGFDFRTGGSRLTEVDVPRLTELVTDAWRMRVDVNT